MNEETDAIATDTALFAKLKGWVKLSLDKHGDWYKEGEECFGFVAAGRDCRFHCGFFDKLGDGALFAVGCN